MTPRYTYSDWHQGFIKAHCAFFKGQCGRGTQNTYHTPTRLVGEKPLVAEVKEVNLLGLLENRVKLSITTVRSHDHNNLLQNGSVMSMIKYKLLNLV